MTDASPALSSAPTQIVAVAPAAPTRWLPTIVAALGAVGSLTATGGMLLSIGAWRGKVDEKVSQIDQRLTAAESNQRQYIPVLVGLNRDVSYLAERARREDDRLARGGR